MSRPTFRELADHPGYRVGDDGKIWSSRTPFSYEVSEWRELKQRKIKHGYRAVRMRAANGKGKNRLVHQIVLETFVGPRPKGMVACHKDGNPSNNALSNLRWDTYKANSADTIRHGRSNRGSRSPMAKLTEANIPEIKALHASGLTQLEIARRFLVDPSTISHVCTGWSWKHIS
jgi:hypothetical protein